MRPPNRLSLYTQTIFIPLFSLVFLISSALFFVPTLFAQEGQTDPVPETGTDAPGIRRLALIGFDTPDIEVEDTSTYTSSNDFVIDYFAMRELGASYGLALEYALASGLADAISAGIDAGFQMADIENNLDMLIKDNTFGSILESTLHREMASVCAFEITPLQEIDRLGLTQDISGNYILLHSRADVQAAIEGTIKEFVFLWNQDGLVNSLGIVVEIKLTDTSTGKVLRQRTYPYYTMTNDDNSFINKRTLEYFYDKDNVVKEFTKASVMITNKIMNDYKLYFLGDYLKHYIKGD